MCTIGNGMTDLISRADAIEAVKSTKPIVRSTEHNWGKMIAEQHSKELVKALKALPSAVATTVGDYPNDVISRNALMEYCSNQKSKSVDNNDIARFPSAETVQGEWLYRWSEVECSVCGEFAKDKSNFCPNCGARMKGGTE